MEGPEDGVAGSSNVISEIRLERPEGLLIVPRDARAAALVRAGSSGRIDEARVRLLAAHGAAALSLRWFGGPGQPPGICEIALETFEPALDRLADIHDHLGVVGTSKGAEAALLLAADDSRIKAVVALAPSSVVWANVGPGSDGAVRPWMSSWTRHGQPLPFVPYDDTWQPPPGDDPPAYRTLYEQSLRAYPKRAADAAIPVERITAEVLVAAGTDDQVWPSDRFAADIWQRRADHGAQTTIVLGAAAGHRTPLPGEKAATGGMRLRRGNPEADARLGEQVFAHVLRLLRLTTNVRPE